MTKAEQHKIIRTLSDWTHKMKGCEADDFEMFRKRDHDDEELDKMSLTKLLELFQKYVPERLR
ncbi:MAG: hypothetical protein QME25_00500 [Bacteroidota bacterium]|jgi:hypothetical protein|nr:hypothetical protein [Bacteroidota bacterium]MBU1422102.1 hypothetical protein [Bacteroidota bacterium]MDI6778670.1 hypothetical protein [Bacteroidota bacterium]